jgi:hypothetical protein
MSIWDTWTEGNNPLYLTPLTSTPSLWANRSPTFSP